MAKKKSPRVPVTQAVRALREAHVAFEPLLYRYEERGGTRHSSRELGVAEHHVIKSLVFEDDAGQLLMVLMHGDCEVAPGLLARAIGARSARPAMAEIAEKSTGYLFGGTSPFGLRQPLPVYAQQSIQQLEWLCINGGKRGFLVRMSPAELERVLACEWVDVAQPTQP